MKNKDIFLKIETWEEYAEKRDLFKDIKFQSDEEVFAHWKELLEAYMKKHGSNDGHKPKTMHDDHFGTKSSKHDS